MHFLLTLSKVLKRKIVLNHFSSLRGWKALFSNTWNPVSFLTPMKEVHWLRHTISCSNDSTSQEMSSLLGVQSDIWLPSSFWPKPQTEWKAALLPCAEALTSWQRDFLKPHLVQKPLLGRVVWNSKGVASNNRPGPNATKKEELKKWLQFSYNREDKEPELVWNLRDHIPAPKAITSGGR